MVSYKSTSRCYASILSCSSENYESLQLLLSPDVRNSEALFWAWRGMRSKQFWLISHHPDIRGLSAEKRPLLLCVPLRREKNAVSELSVNCILFSERLESLSYWIKFSINWKKKEMWTFSTGYKIYLLPTCHLPVKEIASS